MRNESHDITLSFSISVRCQCESRLCLLFQVQVQNECLLTFKKGEDEFNRKLDVFFSQSVTIGFQRQCGVKNLRQKKKITCEVYLNSLTYFNT